MPVNSLETVYTSPAFDVWLCICWCFRHCGNVDWLELASV